MSDTTTSRWELDIATSRWELDITFINFYNDNSSSMSDTSSIKMGFPYTSHQPL